MEIAGFEPLSFIDYPGKVATVVFTQGCNFACPFCHNASLIAKKSGGLSEDELLGAISERSAFIDAVVISGGEPTIHDDLPRFIQEIEEIRPGSPLKVKLDTNGSNPRMLEHLLDQGMLDYVALDLKGSSKTYMDKLSAGAAISAFAQSVTFLQNWAPAIPHREFRFTLDKRTFDDDAAQAVLQMMCGSIYPLYLQNARLPDGIPVDSSVMHRLFSDASNLGIDARIRGELQSIAPEEEIWSSDVSQGAAQQP